MILWLSRVITSKKKKKKMVYYLQMEIYYLCKNELKLNFETKSKIDFYNTYLTKGNVSNLRNLAQKFVRAYKSSYTCESFFATVKIPKICTFIELISAKIWSIIALIYYFNSAQLQPSCYIYEGDIRL